MGLRQATKKAPRTPGRFFFLTIQKCENNLFFMQKTCIEIENKKNTSKNLIYNLLFTFFALLSTLT